MINENEKELLDFYRSCQAYYDNLASIGFDEIQKKGNFQLILGLLQDADTYVDIGCGSGSFVIYAAILRNVYSIGTDISPLACKAGKKLQNKWGTNSDFVVCDAKCLPFRNQSIQKMSSFWLLEHLGKPELSLLEMARCCKKWGTIVLITPHHFSIAKVHISLLAKIATKFLGTKPVSLVQCQEILKASMKYRRNKDNLFYIHRKPRLGVGNHRSIEMADEDAITWIYSETLVNFFKKSGFAILEYDTWASLRDLILRKTDSIMKRIVYFFFKALPSVPLIKHYGPGILVIARKR